MKLIYMGTPVFACRPLVDLHQSAHDVVAVVTGVDERSPRGKNMVPTPVAAEAERLGLPVVKPESLKDNALVESLRKFAADVIVVVAFKILPKQLYTLPSKGAINVHASLLPRYRGAAPINWALINGEKETGLTSFFLKQKVDTGDMILQEKVAISDDDNFDSLSDRLSERAGAFLLRTLNIIEKGESKPMEQDDSLATPAPKITPFDALIDFGLRAENVRNFVRGLSTTPGAYTYFRGKRVKILSCQRASENLEQAKRFSPGSIVIDDKRLLVQCSDAAMQVTSLLPEGKKIMDATSFMNGFRPEPAERFGEMSKDKEQTR